VLPEVLAAVRGRAKVMIDGSFCRGTDIVKAIALGADAVAMGRMYCYALAAGGAAGVGMMLRLLEHELGVAMALSGARSLAELNRSFLHLGAPPVFAPHVHSAFPLLGPTGEHQG
jgi:glycolate oxidase